MPVTNYHTIDGEILGETTNGVRTDYMKDALGSVTGTTIAGVVQNTYRYKPYGGLLAKTGTAADPQFQWNGGSEYRATQRSHSDCYVRARHYGTAAAAWTGRDSVWPGQPPYIYVSARPAALNDPSGLLAGCCCCPAGVSFANIKKYETPSTVQCGNSTLYTRVGASFDVVPAWAAFTPNITDYSHVMSPPTLDWEETGWVQIGTPGSYSNEGFTLLTAAGLAWAGCAPAAQKCANGSCSLPDCPGTSVPASNPVGSDFYLCLKVTLTGSCKACWPLPTSWTSYFRVTWNRVATDTYKVTAAASDANCANG